MCKVHKIREFRNTEKSNITRHIIMQNFSYPIALQVPFVGTLKLVYGHSWKAHERFFQKRVFVHNGRHTGPSLMI
jgi:hypothetical protein